VTRPFLVYAFVVAAAAGVMPPALGQTPEHQAPEQGDSGRATVSSSQVIGAQGADEWLASQLRGTAVIGADNQRIGEVVDVLLDRTGKARAFIVGMGGVMGLGAKEIAIDLAQFHDMPAVGAAARAELKVPLTRDQLAAVPEFKSLPVPDATTGAAPRSSPDEQ